MDWRFWKGRPPAGRAAPGFDAVVDLDLARLPPGWGADDAMRDAEAVLRRHAGAARVRVRVRPAEAAVTLRVFAPGTAREPDGETWTRLRAALLDALHARFPSGPPPPSAPPPPLPMWEQLPAVAGGFAEAPSPALDALEQLASLAASFAPAPSTRRVPASFTPPRPDPAAPHPDLGRMARLLGFVLPHEDRATASAALREFGSYAAVLAAPAAELSRVPGLGPHCVAAVKLVHEAAVRLAAADIAGRPLLHDTAGIAAYLETALSRERVEQFRVLFLDDAGILLADEVQATGTVNHTPVYPREVLRRAMQLRATAFILVHNHPSGDPTPSEDDIGMTGRIAQAARSMRIELRDHIVVGHGRSVSFRAEGLLD